MAKQIHRAIDFLAMKHIDESVELLMQVERVLLEIDKYDKKN